MFQRKRLLKKERNSSRIKLTFFLLFLCAAIFLVLEYMLLNFSLGRQTYISPLAKDKVSFVANIERELEKQGISFTSVNASSDGSLIVNLKDDSVVILSSKKDISSQISSLQLVLSRLTIEGKKLKLLDLRFNNPVVSF